MRAWERPLLGDAKGREGSIADPHPTGRPRRVMARIGQSNFDASFAAYRLISGEDRSSSAHSLVPPRYGREPVAGDGPCSRTASELDQ